MLCWMEVVKEGWGNSVSGGAEKEVAQGQLVLGVAAGALAIDFAYLSLPLQESVPKRAWLQQSRDSAVS